MAWKPRESSYNYFLVDWRKMNITVVEVQAWLDDFAKKIEENKDYLSLLDTPIGDGDHGNNMSRGMTEYKKSIEDKQPNTISDTFKILAMALISKVGGASGPLYGTAFMNMTKATVGIDVISSYEELSKVIEQGQIGISTRGKADFGDKTMLDVWIPVVSSIKDENFNDEIIENAKNSTKDLVAKKGRASYVGERAIGHIDPGATSSSYLFETLLNYI